MKKGKSSEWSLSKNPAPLYSTDDNELLLRGHVIATLQKSHYTPGDSTDWWNKHFYTSFKLDRGESFAGENFTVQMEGDTSTFVVRDNDHRLIAIAIKSHTWSLSHHWSVSLIQSDRSWENDHGSSLSHYTPFNESHIQLNSLMWTLLKLNQEVRKW